MASISLQHSGHSSGASCSLIATNECVVDDFTRLFCSIHARAARTHTHTTTTTTTQLSSSPKTKQNKTKTRLPRSPLLCVRAPLFVSSVSLCLSLSLRPRPPRPTGLLRLRVPRRPSSDAVRATRPSAARQTCVEYTCFADHDSEFVDTPPSTTTHTRFAGDDDVVRGFGLVWCARERQPQRVRSFIRGPTGVVIAMIGFSVNCVCVCVYYIAWC